MRALGLLALLFAPKHSCTRPAFCQYTRSQQKRENHTVVPIEGSNVPHERICRRLFAQIKDDSHVHYLTDLMLPQNQLILGVMGVDVAISEIKKKTPTYRVSKVNITAAQQLSVHGESHPHSVPPPPSSRFSPCSSAPTATPSPSIQTATCCCTPTCDPKYVQQLRRR